MKVLYIEDNVSAITSVRRAVERLGGSMTAAETGAEVRFLLQEHFDLILCDYILPDMLGAEIVAMSRKAWPATPIIVLSGTGLNSEDVEALAAGANAFVMKPIDPVDLEALLKRFWKAP